MKKLKILVLASESESTNILYNSLNSEFQIIKVIIETHSFHRWGKYWLNRIKKIGIFHVFGQILFLLMIAPIIKSFSKQQIIRIKGRYHLNSLKIEESKINRVHDINSNYVIETIKSSEPDIVIINGTSILSDHLIKSAGVPIINIHAGITPLYRGVHGAYWALTQKNPEQCGVTVHFVDSGIDTGNIIEQGVISPSYCDNYSTYPYLQLGLGIQLLKQALNQMIKSPIKIKPNPTNESKCWSHPTIWGYFENWIKWNVR